MERSDRYYPTDRNAAGESRSAFQRDRDRVLYCSAFRRLAGVTQVVHVAEGYLFHNRMTHSLKAAQFGRRVAERLAILTKAAPAGTRVDPDVVESACLAHDLGHPPFGHVAESELNQQLAGADVPDGYEGNAQSFRIVNQLAIRHKDHRGLNLTRATLNALLKYPWPYAPGTERQKKWGHYVSEEKFFDFAHQPNPADRKRCPEAELLDWADDVTYAVHDVEDFYRAGILPMDRILAGGTERDLFLERALPAAMRQEGTDILSELGDIAPVDVKRPFDGSTAQRAALNMLGAQLITKYNTAFSLTADGIHIDTHAEGEVKLLKTLMEWYVFRHPALVAQQYGQRAIIGKLFAVLFDAVHKEAKFKDLIPLSYRDLVDEVDAKGLPGNDDKRERARIVADIISQMTEQEALSYYRRLTGSDSGSIRDQIIR